MLVGRIKVDADIRRLAFGKFLLLEGCGKAVAGRGDGDNHEVLVACIAVDKVEGVTGIVPVQRQVADGVIEDYRRGFRALGRAREEKAEMDAAHDGEKVSGMTHRMSRSRIFEDIEKVQNRTFSIKDYIPKNYSGLTTVGVPAKVPSPSTL